MSEFAMAVWRRTDPKWPVSYTMFY